MYGHATGEGALVYPEYGSVVVNVTTAMAELSLSWGIGRSVHRLWLCPSAEYAAFSFGFRRDLLVRRVQVWCEF